MLDVQVYANLRHQTSQSLQTVVGPRVVLDLQVQAVTVMIGFQVV